MDSIQSLTKKIIEQKSQLDELRPFNKRQLKNLQERFRIAFIQNSNAIEGNTLSLSEVKVLLEDGITIGGKTVREIRETLNHGDLMNHFEDFFTTKKIVITEQLLKKIHTILMNGLIEKKFLGKRRSINIQVSGSEDQFPSPGEINNQMEIFFGSGYSHCKNLEDIAKIHFEFINIHPFVDGNGRIARLLMNIGLIQCGYFPIIIPIVVRNEYIQSLRGKNFDKRHQFFLWQLYENNKDYLKFFSNK